MIEAEIESVLKSATRLFSPSEVEVAAEHMAQAITDVLGEKNPVLLTVMIGGLVATGLLLKHLQFPLVMDYVHATRYRGQTEGKEIHFINKPETCLKGREVLIIDDILDGGITLKEVVAFCKEVGASRVYTAVLADKPDARLEGGLAHADFVGLTVPNLYLFGYGLDYKNYLRNAPGIFAVQS